jgi:formylglycine-generating enzyme required for sulfatase activity
VTHESRSQIRRKPLEPEMVYVPAGPFLMGSLKSDRLRDDVEPVQFELNLDYDYAIGKYPITVGQYRAFVDAGGYRERRLWTRAGWQHNSNRIHPDHWTDRLWAGDDNLPVVGVSWHEVSAYTRWLAEGTGHGRQCLGMVSKRMGGSISVSGAKRPGGRRSTGGARWIMV